MSRLGRSPARHIFQARLAAGAALLAAAATASGTLAAARAAPKTAPRREAVTAVVRLTRAHRSASVSHVFVGADVGFAAKELVVPRGLPAELLIRTSVQTLTGQPPSIALCTPRRFCRARGLAVRHECHAARDVTICRETVPPSTQEAIFPQGRFTLTVREFRGADARARVRVVFVRGVG
jgi:hypothetical protein